MATLVLTAAGGLIAGPVGAALGAIAGQRIDSSLFAPKARQGPRLGDLSIQTSSYGAAIPKIFGTMRVAGTVIWATDLKEQKNRSGGGKGRPKTETYSYSASFAVALSGRPIRTVRRIWADGKLLRGAAGDFKSQTEFRLHIGTEEQPVDPLIAAEEGSGKAAAHRGIAYALFEDFQLADYGNRIPSLTFEIEADAAPVTVGAIAEQLAETVLGEGETPALAGYAASGDTVRAAMEALGEIFPVSLQEQENGLVFTQPGPVPVPIEEGESATRGTSGGGGHTEVSRKAALAVASEVSVTYYERSRDYQTGLQRARRGAAGALSERIALPAVLSADEAKSFAENRLEHLWAGRQTAKLHLPSRWSQIRPGALVLLPGESGTWKVERWSLDRMVVSLELVRVAITGSSSTEASSGRLVSQPDDLHGPTTLFLFDLPALGEELAIRPQMAAMAAGASPGWRRAMLLASFDGGVSWVSEGSTAAPAVLGYALTAAAPGGAALFDERTAVEVELLHDNMWLESRSDEALAAGANVAVLGDELIQFGRTQPIGSRRFRLSRLLRGRRGTEWATSGHVAGERFALVERDALTLIELPQSSLGTEVRLFAQGIGDPSDPPKISMTVAGNAIAPPSPVHLRARPNASGGIGIEWVRRSRLGWTWSAGADVPLGEESEAYRLTLSGSGFERDLTLAEPRYAYTAEQQASDGFAGTLRIEVVQIGTHCASRPAIILFQNSGGDYE